jgi:hypothetical protein
MNVSTRARVHHTGVGRWLQEDPLLGNPGDLMSFNRYLYVNANPVDYSDPTGLALTPPKRLCPTTDDLFSHAHTLVTGSSSLVLGLVGGYRGGNIGAGAGGFLGLLMGEEYYQRRIAPLYDDLCELERLKRESRAILEDRYRTGRHDLIMEEPWPEGC